MKELKCPNCGNVFQVDEADYAFIVNQVRTTEFDAEIEKRIEDFYRQQKAEEQARAATKEQVHQSELSKKDQTISEKDGEIARLKEQLSAMIDRQKLAVETAVSDKDRQIADLKATIGQDAQALQIAVLKERQQASEAAQAKDKEIAELQNGRRES